MKSITILITGAGAPGAPGIIKSLKVVKERKIRIIGVDADCNSSGFGMVDRYYIISKASQDSYINDILKISVKEKVDVIIPLVTAELLKYSRSKNTFESKGIKVSVSDIKSLKVANNKYLLMQHCLKIGIPTPNFKLVANYNDFEKAVYLFGYPHNKICFKPPVSNGMRGFRILSEEIDRLDLLLNTKPTNTVTTLNEVSPILKKTEHFPKLLVMEYLPGDEYSVDILADNGKVLSIIPRTRKKIKMGISFVGETVYHKEIISYSREIVSSLKLTGNIGLQFIEDANGTAKVIESNPRVQGTIVLCTAAGVNMVYLAAKIALGEKVTIPKIKWGTKMIRYWDEIYFNKFGNIFDINV